MYMCGSFVSGGQLVAVQTAFSM
uniref:Uncharacterized protein n=1 Tax=Arundo donax TaxID=35708 RepID=A0A0A9ABW8_ARUDO